MNIGIDARILSGRITGIGRYLLNILKFLPQMDNKNNYRLFMYDNTEFDYPFYSYTLIRKSSLPRQVYEHYWLHNVLPGLLAKHKTDIFFTPYVLVPYKKGNCKNVIVIHDAIPQACTDSYTLHYRTYMNLLVPACIKRSEKVVTVSQSSKDEIVKYYGADPNKIDIMHLWTDDNYKPRNLTDAEQNSLRARYDLPEKFALYVGTIEHRKNILGLIRISDIVKSKGYNLKIVLIGKRGYGFSNINSELEKRSGRLIHIEFMNEKDLPLIYNLAKLFLFPSSYEGFGLPPLEAMKSGIPVVTSDNTSLPEVVGEGGIMHNYTDYDSFSESIIKLLDDKSFYCEMSARALDRAKTFSAEKELPKLLSIFNSVSVNN